LEIEIDVDRANLVGITNADVAMSTAAAISGNPVGIYKEGNKNIPIVVRLRPQDGARLSQIENLYVNSSQENVKVPLLSVATLKDVLETARIRRREHFRTLSILCFPTSGVLASEVLAPIEPKLVALKKSLPPVINYRSVGKRQSKLTDSRISPWFF
jgi:multidrug efflux pump subunit AcrB